MCVGIHNVAVLECSHRAPAAAHHAASAGGRGGCDEAENRYSLRVKTPNYLFGDVGSSPTIKYFLMVN